MIALLFVAATAAARIPEVLPLEKETALALSAAPEHLRAGAGVWALERNGFVKVRESTNGFNCIVNRDGPLNQKPTCYDAEGSATILPKVVFVGDLLLKGTPLPEIAAAVKEGFRTGRFISPRRPGVAYMLSGDIRNYNPQTGQVGSFPPHVMFYAPNLTNEDIGSTGDPATGLPFVAYQGPQGFMIMLAHRDDSASAETRLDGSALMPYKNAWRLSFLKNGVARRAGTVTDELAAVEVDGRHLMKRTQVVKYDNGKFDSRDENIFDPATMAPASMDFWKNGAHVNHREFDGRSVYFHAPGAAMKIVEYPQPPFDFYGGMYGLLFAAMPLREGFSATLPAVDEDDDTYREVAVHVVAREPVSAGALGTVDAWRTEAQTSMGAMRFWVTKSPPYILRLEWDASPGVTAVYSMPDGRSG